MARGVQMPGNLGTLIRSAWAFGLDGVVVGRGTVDPWNPKVVRGSAGGVFHVPLIGEPEGLRRTGAGRMRLVSAGVETGRERATAEARAAAPNLLCADASGEPVEVVAAEGPRDWVLVVGNEGGGISPPLGARERAVAVPVVRGVDSLNVGVAGSILMYALMGAGEGGADG